MGSFIACHPTVNAGFVFNDSCGAQQNGTQSGGIGVDWHGRKNCPPRVFTRGYLLRLYAQLHKAQLYHTLGGVKWLSHVRLIHYGNTNVHSRRAYERSQGIPN